MALKRKRFLNPPMSLPARQCEAARDEIGCADRTQRAAPSPEAIARSIAGIKAAAGSWKDVDVEEFKAYLAERRRLHTRQSVKL